MSIAKDIIRIEMIRNTFKEKLIKLGEAEFVEWVENVAYKETKKGISIIERSKR